MTPLDPTKTVYWRNPRTGRREICETVSTDGRWRYIRLDMPGTPWETTDLTSDTTPDWLPSLPKARRWTATQPATVTT